MMLLIACSSRPPVVIGFAGELTGNGSDLGISARNGALLAVEEVNMNGGILGRQLNMIVKDDAGNPEMAREIEQEFIAEEVTAVIGHITSSQSVAGLEITQPAGLVMLSPISSTADLTGIDDLFFRICADNNREIRMISQRMMTNNQKRLLIFYDTHNPAFSLTYAKGVEEQITALGGEVLEIIPYTTDGSVKLDNLVSQAQQKQPDVILITSSAVDTALLIQHIRLIDWQVPIYISDWAYTSAFLQTGGRAVEGAFLAVSYDVNSKTPAVEKFQQDYRERFGAEPNYAAMQSYEAVLVLAEALKQTGGEAQGLPDALRSIQDFQGLTAKFSIDPFGDVIRPVYLYQVQGGSWITLETYLNVK